jgi:molybdate transport system permease protein
MRAGVSPTDGQTSATPGHRWRVRSDVPFFILMVTLGALYLVLIVSMLAADFAYTSLDVVVRESLKPRMQYATALSLVSCTISAILSVWVAVPIGYLMSRYRFRGQSLVDAILDIPIVLPPLVVGLSLLILFQTPVGQALDKGFGRLMSMIGASHIRGISYEVPAVILAQFTVAAAFAVRTLRVTFEQIDPRAEHVALTLGCSRGQAFFSVALPQAWRGVVAAFTLAWARSLGEFGPILIFAGTTPFKVEVLPSSVYLAFNRSDLPAAVAASLIMVSLSVIVLVMTRLLGVSREAVR